MNSELKDRIEKAARGDMKAFAQMYDDLKVPLYTFILRIVQDRTGAEDVMQEVFLRLFKNPPGPDVKNPRAWIYKIAKNLSLDALKKRRETALDDSLHADDGFEGMLGLRIDAETAVLKLPLEQRQVVLLHLTAGFTFKEISGITGLSVPAAYRRYMSAIKALKNALEGDVL